MIRRPPRSTRTATLIPYTTLFRALTMHWIVRADAGVTSFADLAGKTFIAGGKGSFGERRTRDVFDALGIGDKVSFVDVEMNAAVPALKNGQVAGFATAG